MKRLNISVLLLAFLLMFVIKSSVQQREYLYRGSDDRHANFLQHPRVFLDVSPMAIKKVHDALYCIWQCLENTHCLSINVKVKPDADNKYECQLLATDKQISPDNLKSSKEFNHHSLWTPCDAHENVCQNGGTCRPIPYEMQEYKCECAAGYFGTNCEIDIDECTTSSHSCQSNAICQNTIGSYTFQCRSGYSGDGYSCTDLDECTMGVHSCHRDAVCTNTAGSYTCACKHSFVGDGKSCRADIVSFSTNSNRGRYGPIQDYQIKQSGHYQIKAAGARGGMHTYSYGWIPGTYYGEKGAVMSGIFYLVKGTVLKIVVGQRGGNSVEVQGGQSTTQTAASLGLSIEDNAGTGGGGGSFVYKSDNTLLIAAGGGGGASSGYNGVDGQSGTSGASSVGRYSSNSRAGGSSGQPGVCNSAGASYHGGVGAGWFGQGCARAAVQHGERGGSRAQGWVGGRAGSMNSGYNGGPTPGAVGGFGGGGGGSEDNGASGGGGGYSGGGSGTHEQQAGGGGGSYCAGSGCSGVTGGNSADNGFVKITEM